MDERRQRQLMAEVANGFNAELKAVIVGYYRKMAARFDKSQEVGEGEVIDAMVGVLLSRAITTFQPNARNEDLQAVANKLIDTLYGHFGHKVETVLHSNSEVEDIN